MSDTQTGGSAFPVEGTMKANHVNYPDWRVQLRGGMTLRDYFAAKAMQAWIGTGAIGLIVMKHGVTEEQAMPILAHASYDMADAMITERAK